MLIQFDPDPTNIVKERHVCYFTRPDGDDICLEEVVSVDYKHPQAPNDAILTVIETRTIKKCGRKDYNSGAIVLLEANQKAVAHAIKLG